MKSLSYSNSLLIALLSLACTPEEELQRSSPNLNPCVSIQSTAEGDVCCPEYEEPSCEGDDVMVFSMADEDGCERPVCAPVTPLTQCPSYQELTCEVGEEASTEMSENGCPVPVCVPVDCPVNYIAPLCEEHEEIGYEIDSAGCEVPTCVEINPNQCPSGGIPDCEDGEELTTALSEDGCEVTICVGITPPECPQYMLPLCEDGEVVVEQLDENGCPAPVCVLES